MTYVNRLNWDSSFFGYEVGSVKIEEDCDFEMFKSDLFLYKLIYVFSKKDIIFPNLKLVDKKVLLHLFIEENIINQNQIFIDSFDLKKHNLEELKILALESGMYSRFCTDEKFVNGEYNKLYLQWINNAVDSEVTFDIVVALENNSIIGFATLNKINDSLADIGLVAVSKSVRGQGIGKLIMQECIFRCKQKGYDEVQVVTQLDNLPAMKLYQSSNFKIKEINNVYHIWNL